ncbi:hypothetical protein ABH935_006467 [Catenulispora sp. GAS73]
MTHTAMIARIDPIGGLPGGMLESVPGPGWDPWAISAARRALADAELTLR